MGLLALLHHTPHHRSRQLRWILPLGLLLVVGTVGTLAVQYWLSDVAVEEQFFRAHKTIAHTGELLAREYLIGGGVLLALLGAVGLLALRLTHRIVRPVHTLHVALDALVAGDLGVRVSLHPGDEFQEVGNALNRLADEFGEAVARVHSLAGELRGLAAGDVERARTLATEIDDALATFRLEPRRTLREGHA